MLKEFKEFIARGNVLDLAVAVILGAAFNAIVSSLVKDIITPLIGVIFGGIDFSGLAIMIGGAVIAYGMFIQAIINFVLVALVLFLIIKAFNAFRRKEEPKTVEPPTMPVDTALLTEIRDLLKNRPLDR